MSPDDYGKRLRETLRVLNLTQTDLGNAIGVSQTAVSKWMRGIAYPELPQLVNTSQFLNVSVEYLLTGEDVTEESIAARRRLDAVVKKLGRVDSASVLEDYARLRRGRRKVKAS